MDVVRVTACGICGLLMYGCSFAPVVIAPRDDSKVAWNQSVTERLATTARAGDWLVARGYKLTDHLVTAATLSPWSHVALYDPAHGEVIEAEAQGVHTSTLQAFVEKSQHLLLIRPKWQDEATGPAAVDYARERIGKAYDFLGTVGIGSDARYYCSELAIAAYAPHIRSADGIPRIIKPSEMHRWGERIYDSGAFRITE